MHLVHQLVDPLPEGIQSFGDGHVSVGDDGRLVIVQRNQTARLRPEGVGQPAEGGVGHHAGLCDTLNGLRRRVELDDSLPIDGAPKQLPFVHIFTELPVVEVSVASLYGERPVGLL